MIQINDTTLFNMIWPIFSRATMCLMLHIFILQLAQTCWKLLRSFLMNKKLFFSKLEFEMKWCKMWVIHLSIQPIYLYSTYHDMGVKIQFDFIYFEIMLSIFSRKTHFCLELEIEIDNGTECRSFMFIFKFLSIFK